METESNPTQQHNIPAQQEGVTSRSTTETKETKIPGMLSDLSVDIY